MKIIFCLIFFTIPVFAMEVKLNSKDDQAIEVTVAEIPLPIEKLKKSFSSGLSNIFISTIEVGTRTQVVFRGYRKIRIHYDLWSEEYVMHIEEESRSLKSRYRSQQELSALISNQKFVSTLKLSEFNEENHIWVRFQMVLSPVTVEKQKKIRKWLADNYVSVPGSGKTSVAIGKSGSNTALASRSSGTRHRGIVGDILDAELRDEVSSGDWVFNTGKISISKEQIREK